MFNTIFSSLKKEFALENMSEIMIHMDGLLKMVGEEYIQDKNLKNSVIDAISQILSEHKDP